MRHGIYAPPFGVFGDVDVLLSLVSQAEDAGWDGFFLWDHVLYAESVPFVDTWTALAAMATTTERIRLGPMVTPLSRRRPWVVARQAVTVDHLSRGRLTVGVGLGIDFWREYSAFDEPATSNRRRADLVDDGITILRRLWSCRPVTHVGAHGSIDSPPFLPHPVQEPTIPIWSAALLPLHAGPVRRAARCDGIFPFKPGLITPDDVRTVRERVDRERTDRNPYDVCIQGPGSLAAEYADAGVTWLNESFGHDTPLDDIRRVINEGPPPS